MIFLNIAPPPVFKDLKITHYNEYMSVCLYVCVQGNSRTDGRIFTNLAGCVHDVRKKQLNLRAMRSKVTEVIKAIEYA